MEIASSGPLPGPWKRRRGLPACPLPWRPDERGPAARQYEPGHRGHAQRQGIRSGLETAPKVTTYRAAYTPLLPDLPGVEISAALDIPGHDPIPVGSTDAGVETAFAGLDTDFT
ncbi:MULTISPECIES: hypothetical protein [unclassified Streptomyces]|uniref:hypothetical protein n=1 Tax=unclassified Streptomyces TaxID=2593676 RepID=UPI00324F1E1E